MKIRGTGRMGFAFTFAMAALKLIHPLRLIGAATAPGIPAFASQSAYPNPPAQAPTGYAEARGDWWRAAVEP
jgi:hypothetical protein